MSNYVKQAVTYFKQGDYKNARYYYILAANTYGKELFDVNIVLCERYLKNTPLSKDTANTSCMPKAEDDDKEVLAKQLAATQAKLEHYFSRCQELQYQLMDIKNA